jgi:hypothetical protein
MYGILLPSRYELRIWQPNWITTAQIIAPLADLTESTNEVASGKSATRRTFAKLLWMCPKMKKCAKQTEFKAAARQKTNLCFVNLNSRNHSHPVSS